MIDPINWLRTNGATSGHKFSTFGLNELNGNKFHLSGGLGVKIIKDKGKVLGFLPLNVDVKDGPDKGIQMVNLKCTVYFSKDVAASVLTRVQMGITSVPLYQGFEAGHFYLNGLVRIQDKGSNLTMMDTANEMTPLISIQPSKAAAYSFGDLAVADGMKSLTSLVRDSHVLSYKGKKVTTLVFDKGIGPYHLFGENFTTPMEFVTWAIKKLQIESITVLGTKSRTIVAIPQLRKENKLPVLRAIYRIYELMGGDRTLKFPSWNGSEFTDSPWSLSSTASTTEFVEFEEFIEGPSPEIGEL